MTNSEFFKLIENTLWDLGDLPIFVAIGDESTPLTLFALARSFYSKNTKYGQEPSGYSGIEIGQSRFGLYVELIK